MKQILVGVDGTAGSRNALDQALRLGQLTRRPVRLVNAWTATVPAVSPLGAGYVYDPFQEREDAQAAARRLLDAELSAALGRLSSGDPVTVSVEDREGAAGPALVSAAESAAVVLLGTRGRGRVLSLVGCLAHVLHHAPSPVVVVPGGTPFDGPFRRVVVGVDASPHSRVALAWAYRMARLEASELLVLHAVPVEDQPLRTAEHSSWHRSVTESLPEEPGVPVSVELRVGHAADVLTHEVGPGDLLVVGSRGAGRVAGLVLGSVSSACIAHPSVPVLVVRADEADLPEVFEVGAPAVAGTRA
jgi:nucleotide-binding universal stress UspA family protein